MRGTAHPPAPGWAPLAGQLGGAAPHARRARSVAPRRAWSPPGAPPSPRHPLPPAGPPLNADRPRRCALRAPFQPGGRGRWWGSPCAAVAPALPPCAARSQAPPAARLAASGAHPALAPPVAGRKRVKHQKCVQKCRNAQPRQEVPPLRRRFRLPRWGQAPASSAVQKRTGVLINHRLKGVKPSIPASKRYTSQRRPSIGTYA